MEGGQDKGKITVWRVMDVVVSGRYRDSNISQRDTHRNTDNVTRHPLLGINKAFFFSCNARLLTVHLILISLAEIKELSIFKMFS